MADGGYEMGQGIAGMGEALGQYMTQYHQKHQQQMMQDEVVERLRDQVDPATHKPIFDSKAYERYQSASRTQKAAIFGGMEATVKASDSMAQIAQKMAMEKAQAAYYSARATDSPLAGQPITDDQGNHIGNYDQHGGVHYFEHKTSKDTPSPNYSPGSAFSRGEINPKTGKFEPGQKDNQGSMVMVQPDAGGSPIVIPYSTYAQQTGALTQKQQSEKKSGGGKKIENLAKKWQTSPEAAGEAVTKAGQSATSEEMMRVQKPDGTIVRVRKNDMALLPQGWTVLGAAVE